MSSVLLFFCKTWDMGHTADNGPGLGERIIKAALSGDWYMVLRLLICRLLWFADYKYVYPISSPLVRMLRTECYSTLHGVFDSTYWHTAGQQSNCLSNHIQGRTSRMFPLRGTPGNSRCILQRTAIPKLLVVISVKRNETKVHVSLSAPVVIRRFWS